MNNLKQIGIGVLQYSQDHDEKFPAYQTSFTSTSNAFEGYNANSVFITRSTLPVQYTYTTFWPRNIQPYVKSLKVFMCPSSNVLQTTDRGRKGHYGGNYSLFTPTTEDPMPLASVVTPSTTYMVMDSGTLSMYSVYAYNPRDESYLPGSSPYATMGSPALVSEVMGDYENGRHFGGVNMLFADGHVKWTQSQTLAREAMACGSSSCLVGTTRTNKSAWNPLVNNS